MKRNFKLDRRAFLKGTAGATLALPVLEAMGSEVLEVAPRRFCAIYTANGMSLPQAKHNIDAWSWFPRLNKDGHFLFGKSSSKVTSHKKVLLCTNKNYFVQKFVQRVLSPLLDFARR